MKRRRIGKYELLRKIAAGGMAEIFLARQVGEAGFFRDVVIKRLFRHMAEHERTANMFQYEAKLLSELSHPNIPQVYELLFAERTWHIAMEHVHGYTLADLWRAGARAGHVMTLPVALGTTIQLCEALHHAHERRDRAGRPLRIVHRDVTPHNAMLTHDGVVKLMDFGVAQTAARMDTDAGAVKGTFSYMAPEQVRAKTLDKRADVFALGVILYELTTGTRLFRGNDVQVMTAIVEEDAPRPSLRLPEFPPDLEEIIMTALARQRSKRLPSASHLARALEDFALRNSFLIGPRTLARFVNTVHPYERESEIGAALVDGDDEPVQEITAAWNDETDSDASEPDAARPEHSTEEINLDEVMSLGEQEDAPTSEERPAARHSDAPPALSGFDEEKETTDERPVVLLDSPKREETRGREYLQHLERRLEEDD